MNKKTKAHQRYKTKDGKPAPGVTTVLGELNKPALIHWAWGLGMKKIDYRKYRDKMADIGTIAHGLIHQDLTGEEFDLSEYAQDDIDTAENCLLSYFEWRKAHTLKPILCEAELVSDIYCYGGTPDYYGMCDDFLTIIDYKSGKAIYDEYIYQVAAYKQLLEEAGHKVQKARILRIGRDETEGFEERLISDLTPYFNIFKGALAVYHAKKELKRSQV